MQMNSKLINPMPFNEDTALATLQLLNAQADSAHVAFYRAFNDLAFAEGGDDDWPNHLSPLILAAILPYEAIEEYDNAPDEETYEVFCTWYRTLKNQITNLFY